MRIISGKKRGLKLKSPDGLATRPTEDRIKESLFNILGRVNSSKVLDLFAGTASIGIEFLSRGAKLAYFIESDRSTLKILQDNLQKAGLYEYKVFPYDYRKALDQIIDEGISFDYIYIDPPYDNIDLYENSLKIIHENHKIFDKGLIIVESNNDLEIKNLELFDLVDQRKYRQTVLYFLRRM